MKEIFAHIKAHGDEYLARLKRACAQPSISAQDEGITEMAALTAKMLRDVGFHVTLVPTDGSPVVLGQIQGNSEHTNSEHTNSERTNSERTNSERTLLLYNHYDVQPVDPVDEWSSPPFEPDERDGKLYARGTADNKGSIVSRVCAIDAYLAHHDALPVNIVWVIEGEEETGSLHLDQFVAQYEHLLRQAYGCVWEAGGKNARGRYEIALGCKGLLYVELRIREAARDLHSALAAIVGNSAWRMVWALNTLKDPDERVRIPGFYDDVRPISPAQHQALAEWDFPEKDSLALFGLDGFLGGLSGQELKERLVFGPTCNVDGFHSGYGGPGIKTVLPCEASAKIDFRLVPDQDPERIWSLLRAHLDAEGFDDVEIVSGDGEHPSAGDPAHPFVQTAARTAERIYGHPPTITPMMSATGPVHILCGQFGVPMVTAGVGYAGSRVHAPDEHIYVADFIDGTKYVAALLAEFE